MRGSWYVILIYYNLLVTKAIYCIIEPKYYKLMGKNMKCADMYLRVRSSILMDLAHLLSHDNDGMST